MRQITNKQTGEQGYAFSGVLKSIGTTVLYNNNEAQTPYRIGTVEFKNSKGELKTSTAKIYEGNLIDRTTGNVRMEIGESYACTAFKDEKNNVYIQVSHLPDAERATAEDFDFSALEVNTISKTTLAAK